MTAHTYSGDWYDQHKHEMPATGDRFFVVPVGYKWEIRVPNGDSPITIAVFDKQWQAHGAHGLLEQALHGSAPGPARTGEARHG